MTALQLKFKKIRTLIISNCHISHANMLKNYIDSKFAHVLTVDIYKDRNLNQESLENLDYDFLIANFPLPDIKSKQIVYIESAPNDKDILKIQEVIDALRMPESAQKPI